MRYGEAVRRQKQQDKAYDAVNMKGWAPNGFDISLADVISEFNLDEKQIQRIGELTAGRNIAHAVVGQNVYYRRASIERLFGHAE